MKYLIVVIGLSLAGFAYWTVSPYFFDVEVQEEVVVDLSEFEKEEKQVVQEVEFEENIANRPESDVSGESVIEKDDAQQAKSATPEKQVDRETVPVEEKPKLFQGTFKDADPTHLASGQVFISGQNMSLVNFDSTNVPDGFVYLANDLDAKDFVRVDRLKGNKGNQNYSIPAGVDAADYSYVLIWCRAFGVLVGSAKIN